MAKALLAALLCVTATAFAQSAPAPSAPPPAPAPAAKPAAEAKVNGDTAEEIRREVDAKVAQAKKEMLDELRAQMATKAVAESWQEEWVEEKRKLELFTVDGYFRLRPDLFYKFDLNREPDTAGYTLFPRSPRSENERTLAGANMRLRFEPTLNVSEELSVVMQVDALDNVVLGSSPDYAYSRSDRQEFSIFSESQTPGASAVNALKDSIAVKRAYAQVSTPVGILRFGRMGSQWGLGMLHNDGNCLDCDYGDTVDRIQFVTEPFPGWYVTPMIDFNVEGPTSSLNDGGQPFDLSNQDDAHSYVLALARRDTPAQARTRLDNGQEVFNYGIHFEYRTQKYDPVGFLKGAFSGEGGDQTQQPTSVQTAQNLYVPRDGNLYMPDVWVKYERKLWRLELEFAGIFGSMQNRSLNPALADRPGSNQQLDIVQYGGVLQGEYRFMEGKLRLFGEVGFASGDASPGLGNHPGRRARTEVDSTGAVHDVETLPGEFDGPQYSCQTTGGCKDSLIGNFRFNRDYRVDLILWREILGSVTDAIYVKPTIQYELAEGLKIFASGIYSRTIYNESSPNGTDPNLGIELDGGASYQTEDGFTAGLQYGILIPLTGLTNSTSANTPNQLDTAQTVRGWVGIKF